MLDISAKTAGWFASHFHQPRPKSTTQTSVSKARNPLAHLSQLTISDIATTVFLHILFVVHTLAIPCPIHSVPASCIHSANRVHRRPTLRTTDFVLQADCSVYYASPPVGLRCSSALIAYRAATSRHCIRGEVGSHRISHTSGANTQLPVCCTTRSQTKDYTNREPSANAIHNFTTSNFSAS